MVGQGYAEACIAAQLEARGLHHDAPAGERAARSFVKWVPEVYGDSQLDGAAWARHATLDVLAGVTKVGNHVCRRDV